MDKKYYGKIALISLFLAGVRGILQFNPPLIINITVDIAVMVGVISGIIWVIKSYSEHSVKYNKKRDKDWEKLTSGKMDMTDWLEFDGHITSEANKEIKEKGR